MAATFSFRQEGDTLTLTAPGDLEAGQPALIGSIFGVALANIATGETGPFATCGVHELPKVSAQAWAEGQKIYWDADEELLSSGSLAGPLVGAAVAAAVNPSPTGLVKLKEAVSSTAEGPQEPITSLDDQTGGTPSSTLAAVTVPGTIAATLTDSSGYSGTHGDTIAAMAPVAALTEGGGALGGVQDGNITALVDPAGDAGASLIDGVREVAAKANALASLEAVHAQNISNATQKVIELKTAQDANEAAISDLRDAVASLAGTVNAIITALREYGVITT